MVGQIKVTELPVALEADLTAADYFLVIDGSTLKRIQRDELYSQIASVAKGDKGDVGATGVKGEKGDKGDKGDKGNTGLTGATGAAGATGATGAQGIQGQKGWSPVLAVVSDGARRVMQVFDWVGGAGAKPATGQYISATGLTAIIGNAVDIRGATGATGVTGAAGANGANGLDAKQISTITHLATNAIRATFTDTTFVDSDAPKRLLGWASYQDTSYTSGSPFVLVDGIKTTCPNNSGTVINTYIPFGVTSLYNNGTQKLTPAQVGDGYHFSIRFIATPSAVNMYLLFGVDIGAGTDIFQQTIPLPRGAGTPNPISIDVQGYSLSTFLANGGLVRLTAIGGTCSIHTIEFQIHRTSVAQ